jgi:hypothetical protein
MNSTHTSLTVIAIIAALVIIMTGTIVTPAFAIKRFFNCMTDVANMYGKLTIDDVNLCYDKEYHSGPFATHSHSTNDAGSSSTTIGK